MDRAGLGKLHDTIPLVAGTAERAALFPAPDLHQRVQRLDTGCIQEWNGTEWVNLLCAADDGNFVQAEYVVMSLNEDLTDERRLQVGAGLTMVDAGANNDVTLSVTCVNLCGNGSPEGVQTAAVGTWYLQRDAASTTIPTWLKRTGTGNTGWVAYSGHRGTGTQSLALGDSSVASATNAQSFGQSANASAADTLAVGRSSAASAANAQAVGQGATASGADSIAVGTGAIASAASAVALGKSTTASGTRSEAIGEGSTASATDAKAFGVGATAAATEAVAIGALATVNASATQGIALGPGAIVDASAVKGISVGDGRARASNDIIVGFGNDIGQALAHPSIVVGKSATVGTTADASSPTPSDRGGHVVIGENASAGMGPSAFPNTIIGRDASSVGRAVIAIGQGAQARAANTPVSGQSAGLFATIIGYLAKGSGGCIVSVGDQADVRGDNTAAVGTHARANDNNTAAFGPNAFAGSTASTGAGVFAAAFGVSAQAKGLSSIAIGTSTAQGNYSITIGDSATSSASHERAIALGAQAETTSPRSIMIGGEFEPIYAIHFNGSSTPGMLISPDGKVEIISGGSSEDRQLPIAGNVTLTDDDRVVFINSTASNRTVQLPASGSVNAARLYYIRKDTAANLVTILPDGAETIDGEASFMLTAQWDWALILNDGGDWSVEDTSV